MSVRGDNGESGHFLHAEDDCGRDQEALQPFIMALTNPRLRRLQFPPALELYFETLTGGVRSRRLWSEGLLAIVLFNLCLLLDCLAVHDEAWSPVLWKLLVVTPIALLANQVVRGNPPPLVREGAVALAICLISTTTVFFESSITGAGATYAQLSIVICALFGNVVMRLRFPFAVATTAFLFTEGAGCGILNRSLQHSERSVALSLSAVSMGLTLLAAYSLERDERLTFLLRRSGELKNEQIAEANKHLLKLAESDVLTGLPNRRLFLTYLQQEWDRARNLVSPLSIIAIDVDHFKKINDSHGHPYGDEVLRRIGALLLNCLHSHRDMAARCGGEEFIVILPDTDEAGAVIVAERIRALVRATASPPLSHSTSAPSLFTTVSCGVCSYSAELAASTQDLLATADAALYDAKREGRDRVKTRNLLLAPCCNEQVPTRESLGETVILPP